MVENLNSNIHKGVFSTVQRLIEEREIAQASRSAAEAPAEATAEAPAEATAEAPAEATAEAPAETAEAALTDPSPKKLNAFAKLKARVDDARSRNEGPKEVLNRLHSLKRSYRLAIEKDNANPSHPAMVDIDNYIQEIEAELVQQGYEVEDPTGSLWNEGRADLTVVTWNPNPEAEGKETKAIIVDTTRPIIRKDGEIIQTGQVVAEERPLSDSEIATKIEQEKSMRQRLEERTSEAPNPPPSEQAEGTPTPPPEQTTTPVNEDISETDTPPIDLTKTEPQSDFDQFITEQRKENDC